MDISSIAGILIGIFVLYYGIANGSGLQIFLNLNAFIIVMGGTLASVFIGTPTKHIFIGIKETFKLFFSKDRYSPADIVLIMIELSRKAHRYGIGSIKDGGKKARIKFLDRALKLALSGLGEEDLRRILEKEIIETREGQREASNIFRTMGMFAPMFGLVGTIVGIMKLLSQLSNIEAIGPSMAIAIITTFYGIFLANLIFVPIANKIRLNSKEETLKKEMILEGVIAIKKGEIPYMIKNQLESYVKHFEEIKEAK